VLILSLLAGWLVCTLHICGVLPYSKWGCKNEQDFQDFQGDGSGMKNLRGFTQFPNRNKEKSGLTTQKLNIIPT
jgi:hypothetical protein